MFFRITEQCRKLRHACVPFTGLVFPALKDFSRPTLSLSLNYFYLVHDFYSSYISLGPFCRLGISNYNPGYAVARLLALLRNDVMCTYEIFFYARCGHNSGIRPKFQCQTRNWYPVRFDRPNGQTVHVNWRDPCWPQQGVNVQEHQMGRTQGVCETCRDFLRVRKAR